jgi:hypothetical protein
MSTNSSNPTQLGEKTKLEALYRDLDLFLTQPLMQFDDPEPILAGDIRKELGRLKAQICRVEKALEGLPYNATLDQVSQALEQEGMISSSIE